MRVEIDLLGGFAVRVDGRPGPRRRVAPPAGGGAGQTARAGAAPDPAPRAGHRRAVARRWPSRTRPPRLHKAAHYARRALGDPRALVLTGDTVSAVPRRRRRRGRRGVRAVRRQALAARRPATPTEPAAAAAAADLWTGDLLPEDPYEPWLEAPRDRLRQLHREVLRRAGRWEELARADPADEEASLAARAAARRRRRPARGAAAAGAAGARAARRARRHARARPSRRCAPSCSVSTLAHPRRPRRPPPPPLGRDAELGRIDRLLAAAARGPGPDAVRVRAGGHRQDQRCCAGWTGAPRNAACASGVGTAAAIEGAWPYAPVLEALADLCRRHPALLDGLADEYRVEIEGALRGTSAGVGPARAGTSGCSSAPPSCCGSRPPAAARCSSSTTPTTPTRPACGCCTTCPAPRSASGS